MIVKSPATIIATCHSLDIQAPNGHDRHRVSRVPRKRSKSTFRLPMLLQPPSALLVICALYLFVSAVNGFNLGQSGEVFLSARGLNLPTSSGGIHAVDSRMLQEREHSDGLELGSRSVKAARGFTMPRAFDTSLGRNFTSPSCPKFFDEFLNEPKFLKCAAVSLMLQTSASFFDDTKSKRKINRVLEAACAVPAKPCSALMKSISQQILRPSACQADYYARNPVVAQAYAGLRAYDAIRQATCLRNSEGGTKGGFCFSNAVTNASSPTSSYVYYLPLGISLPAGAIPSCNSCLWHTMRDFAAYAADGTQPLALTYSKAATSINIICGPEFAKADVKIVSNAAGKFAEKPSASLIAFLTIAILLLMW